MSPVTVYSAPAEQTSPRFCAAFASGAGAKIARDGRLRQGDVALFGSPALWELLTQALAEGRDWFYGDHAYFGRGKYFRVTRGSFQPATQPLPAGDPDRLEALGVQIQPWRRDGRHILVCPPTATYAGLMRRAGVQVEGGDDWGAWAAAELARYTDRPVRIRTKAEFRASGRPLAEDLDGAWAVVAHMSNAALEAALLGYPIFVLGPSAARPLARTDLAAIEDPFYPDNRREVAAGLAASQWTLEQLAAGDCWRALS